MRRPLKISQAEFQRGLAMLGFSPADFRLVLASVSREDAERKLAELKIRLKREFKRKALELHPDRVGSDDRVEDFVLLQKVVEAVGQFEIAPRQQPVVVGTVVSTGSSTTTTSTNFGTVWVRMG